VEAPGEWPQLLQTWASLLDRYIGANVGDEMDVPYWYGERALTGLLAAAAWSLPNCWSLEEFLGRRGNGGSDKAGRGDLWIGGKVGDYTIEAKHCPAYDQASTAVDWARDRLDDAARQLRALAPVYRWGKPVALCYVVPDLQGTLSTGQCAELCEKVGRGLAKDVSIVATYQMRTSLPKDGGRVYPGVIVVGKILPGWA